MGNTKGRFCVAAVLTSVSVLSAAVQLTTEEHQQRNPAISGKIVVHEYNRSGNWDIWVMNLETRETWPICTE